jgi:peptidase M50B-like protein
VTGSVTDIWDRSWGSQPAPEPRIVALTGVLAFVLVAVPSLWRLTRHVVTIAHEGAHGVAALLSGRRLAGIRLHSDTSGLTLSRGRTRGPGMIATAAAGYLGPALLGLGAAYLLHRGHAVGVLWLALLLLALLLLQIRNFYGLYSVLAAAVAVFAVSWWGSPEVQTGFAYAGTWVLLLAAPRPVLELQQERRRRRARDSDADILARLTHIPGLAWVALFLLGTLGCLLAGGYWLIGFAR